ncbi:MAG TPA: DUF2868 domain-containing protein [Casimicrobiaceae bacterium]
MNEASARAVVLVQAIESADAARGLWSDAERVEVGQTAARELGQSATFGAWIARRAALALARLRRRVPTLEALARARVDWGVVSAITIAVAFVVGVGAARIGPSQRINLLAPPLAALLAWNLAVYLVLAWMHIRAWMRPKSQSIHRLRAGIAKLAAVIAGGWRRTIRSGPLVEAGASFAMQWTRLAMPLGERRATGLLHVGAAAVAVGAIAALYVRGLALEYRAVWQSTFLDAGQVATLLRIVLAPGALVTGLTVPGADELARVGPGSAGANAARWIHLYAGTLLVVVIVPRLVLAAVAWTGAIRASRRFPLALDAPYFRRLARAWRSGTTHVRVIPYSYDAPARSRAGLEAVLTRALETPIDSTWTEPVRYGDDPPADDSPGIDPRGNDSRGNAAAPADAIALFNLSATPEVENHVAFVTALAHGRDAAAAPIVIVDTSEFAARFHGQPGRIAEREAAWRDAFESASMTPIFMRLAAPDLDADAAALAAELGRDA